MTTVSKQSFVLLFSSSLTDPVFCSGNVIYEKNCPALPRWVGFLFFPPFPGTVTLPRSFTSDLNSAGTALPPLHGHCECTEWSHMYQNLGVNRGNSSPAPPAFQQSCAPAALSLGHSCRASKHFRKIKGAFYSSLNADLICSFYPAPVNERAGGRGVLMTANVL